MQFSYENIKKKKQKTANTSALKSVIEDKNKNNNNCKCLSVVFDEKEHKKVIVLNGGSSLK